VTPAAQKIREYPVFKGYRDCDGRFIPFSHAEAVLTRARRLGARILLRLELDSTGELQGMLHTNQRGLGGLKLRKPAHKNL
jgi:hypothetical protein